MISQANDAETFYPDTVDKFTEATGIEIEVIPYPADAYNTQVTTQLQAGNAADMMILSPGTGSPSRLPRLLRPASSSRSATRPPNSSRTARRRSTRSTARPMASRRR